MPTLETLRRLSRRAGALRDRLSFIAPLATRATIGLGKLEHLERTTAFFTDLGIPAPGLHAAFIGGLETVGGLMLMVGLAVRPVAALLCATMVVALGTAEREGFVASWSAAAEAGPTDIAAWVYLLLTSWVFFHGAGAVSLDALLRRVLARGESPAVRANVAVEV
jgi:putative oxidoreductase